MRAVLAVPLLHQAEVVGGLVIRRNQPGTFSQEIIRLAEAFAAQSAITVENARLFGRSPRRAGNLSTVTSQYEDFHRQETGWSGLLYKCENAKYAHKLARLDLATSCDMRCPSAATGVYHALLPVNVGTRESLRRCSAAAGMVWARKSSMDRVAFATACE